MQLYIAPEIKLSDDVASRGNAHHSAATGGRFVDSRLYRGIFPLGLSRQRHPREKRDRAPYQSLHVSPPFSFGAFTISVDIFKTFLIGFLRQVHLQAI